MKALKYVFVLITCLGVVLLALYHRIGQTLFLDETDSKKGNGSEAAMKAIISSEETTPNLATYYWCGNERRLFEFGHYLSMFSVIRALHPDVVYFIYEQYPSVDDEEYNVWLDDIKRLYPFVYVEKLKNKKVCSGSAEERLAAIMSELSKRGGFYVNENTILTQRVSELLHRKQVIAGGNCTACGFMMTQKGMPFREGSSEKLACSNPANNSNALDGYCVNVLTRLYPKDIWELDNDFGQLARWAAYGETSFQRPQPDYTQLAPNIAHYVWIGNGKMDFTMYLSVLSVLYAAKVHKVFIHGTAPSGHYWDKIKTNPKITIIHRDSKTYVFGEPVSKLAHRSDVWRVDILYRFGGLYLDRDVIFVKPLSKELRAYDVVISLDALVGRMFPGIFQNGIMLGKKGGKFWEEFIKSMQRYKDNDWLWNSSLMPYKVKERYPKYLFIYDRLQVNCPQGKCHPTWWPNYLNKSIHHLNSNSLPDWRNDAYGYHFAGHGAPPELRIEKKARTTQTIFGEMARYVLDKAGLPNP